MVDNHLDRPGKPPRLYRPGNLADALRQVGTPEEFISRHPSLVPYDMRLAELYRLSYQLPPTPAPPPSWSLAAQNQERLRRLNPLQASLDDQEQLWVDVLFELREGVPLSALQKMMKIHAFSGPLVSGSVQAERLPDLAPLAKRLRAASPVSSLRVESLPAIQADQASLAQVFPGRPALDGTNTIIGVVDFGCDFAHDSFVKNGQSRILRLWHQTGSGGPAPQPFGYGVEYTREMLNAALLSQPADPYTALGYKPDASAHGTHVMDIAAGNLAGRPGVAPGAEIIFVHLGNPAAAGEDELKTLGSSKLLFDAVMYIFNQVDAMNAQIEQATPGAPLRPVVINISLGANGGAHDGASTLEKMFDRELRAKPGRAIVLAAGNTYNKQMHTSGSIKPNKDHVILWDTAPQATLSWDLRQELEIWYSAAAELLVELRDPHGNLAVTCALGQAMAGGAAGSTNLPLIISHLPPDSEPGEDANHVEILLDNRAPGYQQGTWSIRLLNVSNKTARFNAWIEQNELYPSTFESDDSSGVSTLNAIGNAQLPLLVGASALGPGSNICAQSSSGPSLNPHGRDKPEICAPGLRIDAANALSKNDTFEMDGTSMAAPHVTGVIALMFQLAAKHPAHPRLLDIAEIRTCLIAAATPRGAAGHHNRFGFGYLNAAAALQNIDNN